MSKNDGRTIIKYISATGILACGILTVVAWKKGILTSEEEMQRLISRAGIFGELLFIIIQVVQVIFPIIPGGISCLAGVLMFGPIKGFLFNYIGICIGSMGAFAISKYYGRPVMDKLFSEKSIRKYEAWTESKGRFAKFFAVAIFLPVAPDDLLCFLAGTTTMSWKRFTAIIWLCKPTAIAMYSMGLTAVFSHAVKIIGG